MSWIYDDESLPEKDADPNPIPPGMESVYYGKADWDAVKDALEDTRDAMRAGKGVGFAPLAARPTITGVSRLLWLKNDNRWQLYNGTIDDPIVTESVLATQLGSYATAASLNALSAIELQAGSGVTLNGGSSPVALGDGPITIASTATVTAPLTLTVDDTNDPSFPLVLRHTDSGGNGAAGLEVGISFQVEDDGGGTPPIGAIRAVLTDATADAEEAYLTLGASQAGTVTYPVRMYGGGLDISMDGGLTFADRGTWAHALTVATTDTDASQGILLINESVPAESDSEKSPELTFAWHAKLYQELGGGLDIYRVMNVWGESIDNGSSDPSMHPAIWVGSDASKPVFRVSDDGLNAGAGQVAVFYDASSADTAPDMLVLRRTTSGTAAAGIGASILLQGEDDGGAVQDAGRVSSVLSVTTAGSEKGYTSLSALNGAGSLAVALAAWGTARVGLGALGVTEPSATVHARSEASAAAALPVAIWDKMSGGAAAGNRFAEWYRDTSTLLAYLEADGSDHVKLGVGAAGKNFVVDAGAGSGSVVLSVGGSTKLAVGVTVTTSNQPITLSGSNAINIGGALNHDGTTLGVYGATPVTKPTVSGSRGGNAALASLLTALASQGFVTDSSSA